MEVQPKQKFQKLPALRSGRLHKLKPVVHVPDEQHVLDAVRNCASHGQQRKQGHTHCPAPYAAGQVAG